MYIFNISSNLLSGQDSLKYWQVNTRNDYFWEPNCPIMDGYTLWALRQKMTLEGYQAILNNEINLEKKSINKIQFTNYLPFICKGNFNSMIGTRYSKFDIQSDNEYSLNKSIQHVWLWTAWQYKYLRWNFTLTTESYFKGDENTLFTKTGNQFFSILFIGYELNNHWNLILFGGYNKQQMNGQATEKPIVALQGRYQPSSKLKLLFGVPTIFAAEWTVFTNTDFGMKYFITNESQFFIRQRISNNIGISIQYISVWNHSSDTYFNNSIFNTSGNNEVTFNNISYLQPQLYVDIDFKLFNDIGFSIGLGYNLHNKMRLYDNTDMVYDAINSKDNIFINCSLQFIKLK